MIRVDELTRVAALDNLEAFLDAYPELALETLRDGFNAHIKPDLLHELRYYPGEVVHPFQFATPKSRRWYFFAVHTGLIKTDGRAYIRTGQFAQGWDTDVTIGDGSIVMSVTQTLRATRFITGNRQVPGHRRTGWQLHAPTIAFWREAAQEQAVEDLNKLVNQR